MHTQARQLAWRAVTNQVSSWLHLIRERYAISANLIMSAARGRVVERLVEVEDDLRAAALDRRVVARVAARRRVVRHVARDLAVRLEHADKGEDLYLADRRNVAHCSCGVTSAT